MAFWNLGEPPERFPLLFQRIHKTFFLLSESSLKNAEISLYKSKQNRQEISNVWLCNMRFEIFLRKIARWHFVLCVFLAIRSAFSRWHGCVCFSYRKSLTPFKIFCSLRCAVLNKLQLKIEPFLLR